MRASANVQIIIYTINNKKSKTFHKKSHCLTSDLFVPSFLAFLAVQQAAAIFALSAARSLRTKESVRWTSKSSLTLASAA